MTHPPPPRQRLQEVDFRRQHTVRWQEVDALGQVDVPSYIRMMEETEYAFLRSLNLSIVMQDERGIVGFPRVTAAVEIQNAARLGDALEIWLQVVCNDGVKIGYRFEITRLRPGRGLRRIPVGLLPISTRRSTSGHPGSGFLSGAVFNRDFQGRFGYPPSPAVTASLICGKSGSARRE